MIEELYQAFNARQIDAVLERLTPDVDWPNGMEGGRVHGREAVRDYWLRQWAVIDPSVTPRRVTTDEAGQVVVDVHQIVRDRTGQVLADRMVQHVYTFRDGLIARMDIREN
jgi:hypothetical protein